MTATVKLDAVLPPKSGVSANGKRWTVQEFVVETDDKYPKKIAMSLFGDDKVKQLGDFRLGDKITVDFDIESREFNGRWYTQCNAWRLTGLTSPAARAKEMPQEQQQEEVFPF